ncbi:MAG: RagB/SusD family nutrient uptake outer membrane protein [Paludibacteraceae bacterium]|nr:RagB/SusD family nutrient uptake outer membrane protein [Paludibacteraceae bacterium]
MKKNIIIIAVAALALTACKDDFLERYPEGGTIRQDQYEKLSDQLEGSVRGCYSKLYQMGGSSHDEFGKRSIDLWGDILSCDIALTNKTYGWLYTDEQMLTVNRTGTIWGHYYSQLHNINATILAFKNGSDFVKHLETYGYPTEVALDENGKPLYDYTDNEYDQAIQYAQILSLRGYIYSMLVKWYTPVPSEETESFKGYTIDTYDCCPLYTEDNMNSPQPLAKSAEIYERVFNDLSTAIRLYEEFGYDYERSSKLEIDLDVAHGILAQAYLNEAVYRTGDEQKDHLQKAIDNAQAVIDRGRYDFVPNKEILENGFNNIKDKSWMWGQEVTVETTGGLKSWFGQVDIHSYSYAWAGDTKVIDQNLYDQIPSWDIRRLWFNDGHNKKTGKEDTNYKLCPDYKFFSAQNPESTHEDDIDRDWLSDNVFMRYESMYLIAAEAAYRDGQYSKSADYLKEITSRRINTDDFEAEDDYNDFVSGLSDQTKLRDAIVLNWRVEMWGEGYGLETFRRWYELPRSRGGNHDYLGGQAIKATDSKFNMQIPSSESTYNPNVKDTK